MSATQFAMVEELAYLVKDNLRCKHLVLSMEDAFVNFLQDDNNARDDGILELQPMDPYSRLLLHRLADIFGFAHVSVGEGDERHLILEKCPDTSVPSILVSDILGQYAESESLTVSHQLLRRNDASPVLNLKSSFLTLEEREAAYLAARERIFSMDVGEMKESQKQKPRNVPMVARRMIAHALGQKISPQNENGSAKNCRGYEAQNTQFTVKDGDKINTNPSLEDIEGTIFRPQNNVHSPSKTKGNNHKCSASLPGKKISTISTSDNGLSSNRVKEYSKEEHMGAAKRMFANALGLQTSKNGLARDSAAKSVNKE